MLLTCAILFSPMNIDWYGVVVVIFICNMQRYVVMFMCLCVIFPLSSTNHSIVKRYV
jgi:hypothetical protein